jgi:hypothetical protein
VVRGGQQLTVTNLDVVVGDVMLLEAGDKIIADGYTGEVGGWSRGMMEGEGVMVGYGLGGGLGRSLVLEGVLGGGVGRRRRKRVTLSMEAPMGEAAGRPL